MQDPFNNLGAIICEHSRKYLQYCVFNCGFNDEIVESFVTEKFRITVFPQNEERENVTEHFKQLDRLSIDEPVSRSNVLHIRHHLMKAQEIMKAMET